MALSTSNAYEGLDTTLDVNELGWQSTASPGMARAAATTEWVEEDLAWLNAEAEVTQIDLSVPDAVAPPPPLGFDWRAHRLFDISEGAEVPDRPAVMRVVVVNPIGDGRVIGTRVLPDYSRFFLQGVSEQDMEKAHIVETFGAYWVHLFGRKPRVFTFNGTLLSAPGQDWEAAWDILYDRYMRATMCVEMGTQVQMTYGGRSAYGYILGCNKNKDSVNNQSVSFTFSMLVTHVEWVARDRILQSQFGISDIDGLVEQGDLQNLGDVAAVVATKDAAAGDTVGGILAGTEPPSTTIPADDQVAFLASIFADDAA